MLERPRWRLAELTPQQEEIQNLAIQLAQEIAPFAAELAVSVLGGEGTTTDQPLERYLRDATTFQFAQGSPQVQRLVVAHELFD